MTGGQRVEAVNRDNTTSVFSGLLSNVTTAGMVMNFTGGVIHIIDSFLTIPSNISNSAVQLGLSSSVGALQAANLATTVDSLMDVTCFIPNNDAFQAVAGSLATLPISNLTSILEYHVVNGTVGYSTDLTNMTMKTLTGQNLAITVVNGSVFVNSARVVTSNVLVANGVVHVIDGVLNPMNATASPVYSASTQMPAFSGASSGSMAPFTSDVPTATTSISTPTITATETTGAAGSAGASPSATSSGGAANPKITGAMGAAVLFGGAAVVMNL